jgi:hypothetical protein
MITVLCLSFLAHNGAGFIYLLIITFFLLRLAALPNVMIFAAGCFFVIITQSMTPNALGVLLAGTACPDKLLLDCQVCSGAADLLAYHLSARLSWCRMSNTLVHPLSARLSRCSMSIMLTHSLSARLSWCRMSNMLAHSQSARLSSCSIPTC